MTPSELVILSTQVFLVSSVVAVIVHLYRSPKGIRDLLVDKRLGTFSPMRLQLLGFSVFLAFGYFVDCLDAGALLTPSDEMLVLFAGSNGAYIAGKAVAGSHKIEIRIN